MLEFCEEGGPAQPRGARTLRVSYTEYRMLSGVVLKPK